MPRSSMPRSPRLLGLDVHQFTTCVVLPQGQFARFLQARPAERQTLLVRLLELGLYDTVREAAGQRAGRLEGERAGIGAHLAALAVATPEAIAAERERCRRLGCAQAQVEDRLPELEAAERQRDGLQRTRCELKERAGLLATVPVPAGVVELAERVADARERLSAAEAAEQVAADAVDTERAVTRGARRAGAARGLATGPRRAGRGRPAAGGPAEEARSAADRQARLDHTAREVAGSAGRALEAYEAAVAGNRAAALRAAVVPGDRCPVCEQAVTVVPHHEDPPELSAARTERDRAAEAHAAATDAARDAALHRGSGPGARRPGRDRGRRPGRSAGEGAGGGGGGRAAGRARHRGPADRRRHGDPGGRGGRAPARRAPARPAGRDRADRLGRLRSRATPWRPSGPRPPTAGR